MSLYSETLKQIERERLLDGVRTLVVALSGGPDSVCLLDLLAQMKSRGDIAADIRAAHLNHMLRGEESDGDEAFCRKFAANLNVPLVVARRDVRAARDREGGSLEEAARRERYAFLAAAAGESGAQAVALGHTGDDQIETFLHRLIRGAGLRGLRGMPSARPISPGLTVRIIRPLLFARRAEILAHLSERELAFRTDSSNRDASFLRNRIRLELLPLLESMNPRVGNAALRVTSSVADAMDFLRQAARAAIAESVTGGSVDLARFNALHPALKPLVIDAALPAGAPQLDAAHYAALIDLADAAEPNAAVNLPGDIVATRTRTALRLEPHTQPAPPSTAECTLQIPGETAAPEMIVSADLLDAAKFDFAAFKQTKTRYDEVVDYDRIAGPLVVRPWRPGDIFHPLGAGGRKKVGDFLTDLRVPAEARAAIPVVCGRDAIVWLVGFRLDDRVKITPATRRMLRLSVKRPMDSED